MLTNCIQAARSSHRLEGLLERVDLFRLDACRKLSGTRRAKMGQFLTPMPTARLMASMFGPQQPFVQLLDAGAGVGSLSAAFAVEMCNRDERPRYLSITAYELDPMLAEYLEDTLAACRLECNRAGVDFEFTVLQEDFIAAGTSMLRGDLFARKRQEFDAAILNPPYRKIHSESQERRLLRTIGVETSNMYTGFLAIVSSLLVQGGELVAITPRSFANGPYFRPFRELFLRQMGLRRIHVFDSRETAFRDDGVLQENVIFCAAKGEPRDRVLISASAGPEDESATIHEVEYVRVVSPSDADSVIHIVPDEMGRHVEQHMHSFRTQLEDLGLSVSTGRVVDFRATQYLRAAPGPNTAPLIYPTHITPGKFVAWPKSPCRKPNALVVAPGSMDLLVPSGIYVLVRRFSAKEERRRIVAAIYDPARLPPAELVGFENHLNYYHVDGHGMSERLAKGLAVFLNSTLVDEYFRQFSGHTQVNATDLRSIGYPERARLEALGARIGNALPGQEELDRLVHQELLVMSDDAGPNPVAAKTRLDEALGILKMLGLPREQQNERSALALLALLDLKPETPWSEARGPLCGITPMMEFFEQHYGKRYAPNTRETVRRQTVHQFLDAGLIVRNPDDPSRPVNSPETVYQIERSALEMLRTYDSPDWDKNLRTYLSSVETLKARYAREREMAKIPVTVAPGKTIALSPGGQNVLVKQVIDEFCPRFTPGGKLLYVGDTDEKWAYFDEDELKALGVTVDEHGKMPDVVVCYGAKQWLVLVEAVTSHGPVNPKRRAELESLFAGSRAALVFVTAFLTRRAMVSYLSDISWETEVWVAEAPSHMIHFNGERFLGPS